jgi:hypothetical protein
VSPILAAKPKRRKDGTLVYIYKFAASFETQSSKTCEFYVLFFRRMKRSA